MNSWTLSTCSVSPSFVNQPVRGVSHLCLSEHVRLLCTVVGDDLHLQHSTAEKSMSFKIAGVHVLLSSWKAN